MMPEIDKINKCQSFQQNPKENKDTEPSVELRWLLIDKMGDRKEEK